jgi:hypothetical protein
MNAKLILVGLASVVALAPLGSVNAQDWGYGSAYSSNGWGFGWPTSCGAGDGVPYFALFPPVYYSYRVPRTYGYSPFAYPPGILTPSPGLQRMAGGQNASLASDRESPAQQGRPPLRINNPFVVQSGSPAATISRQPPVRQPKVIYPAAMARRGGEPAGGS